MKILYITNIGSGVSSFCKSTFEAANELGAQVYYASNFSTADRERLSREENEFGVKFVHFSWDRSPYSLKNIKVYFEFKQYVQREHFDIIFCNTPIGGVMGRLVGAKCKVPRVIYMVHGFHFYKGAPKTALLYKAVEKFLARKTDTIITINQEDYEAAQAFRLKKNGNVYKVNGVGIDLNTIADKVVNIEEKRNELGLTKGDIAIISVGEINTNKNTISLINAMKLMPISYKLYLCGSGEKEEELKLSVKLADLQGRVKFLGFRKDVIELLKSCDVFVLSSLREGLPRVTMEAMTAGIPIVASQIRGNVDLIGDGINGFLVDPTDYRGFAEKIQILANNKELCNKMVSKAKDTVKDFSIDIVKNQIRNILEEQMK